MGKAEIKIKKEGVKTQELYQKRVNFKVYFVYLPTEIVRELNVTKNDRWNVMAVQIEDRDFIILERLKPEKETDTTQAVKQAIATTQGEG
jgi:hypothetical protein